MVLLGVGGSVGRAERRGEVVEASMHTGKQSGLTASRQFPDRKLM
jgi:hypothetical protein